MSKLDTKYSITIPYSSFQIVPTLIEKKTQTIRDNRIAHRDCPPGIGKG